MGRKMATGSKPIILVLLMIVLWDVVIRIFHVPPYQVPAPMEVVRTLWTDWPELLSQAVPTTEATLAGFALSAMFGITLAMLIASSRTVEDYVYPLLVFSQSIPKVAVAPLFVVWFGFGMLPKVISAFLLGFFPVVVAAVQGFKSVEPDMIDLARAMEAGRMQLFRMISLPHALPSIFAGLKVAITLTVVGAVVGEFVGSNSGLGFVLQRSIGNFELPTMFAALIVLAAIGMILFALIELAERLTVPWHASQRGAILATA
ncbi:MAG: ABC transporter permease [Acetobacteraceae bacterium]|nr:ABC transporter permease [Acetobacteraceae bacterium]